MDTALISALVAAVVGLIIKGIDVLFDRRKRKAETKALESQVAEVETHRIDMLVERTDAWADKMWEWNQKLESRVGELQQAVSECIDDRKLLEKVIKVNRLKVPKSQEPPEGGS